MDIRRSRNGGATVTEPSREDANVAGEAWHVLDIAIRWVTHADAKAGAILAACGIVGGALYSVVKGGDYGHRGWVHAAAIVCAVLLTCAAAEASLAIRPRRSAAVAQPSLIYFDHVGRRGQDSQANYVVALSALLRDSASLADQISMQIWEVSRVASVKFVWVNRSLVALVGSLFALGITMLAAVFP